MMDGSHLLIFAAAYLAALILPGPGVTAVVARVLARGLHGIPAFITGSVIGSLVWFTIATTGLALLAETFASVFIAIRYAGAAYLLYLAWKFWKAPPRPLDAGEIVPDHRGRLFLTGLAINLGNPKVMVFFLALLPAVVRLDTLHPQGFAELAGVIVLIVSGVLSAYAILAARARKLFTTPRAVRLLNRGSGTVMAGAAIAIVAR